MFLLKATLLQPLGMHTMLLSGRFIGDLLIILPTAIYVNDFLQLNRKDFKISSLPLRNKLKLSTTIAFLAPHTTVNTINSAALIL